MKTSASVSYKSYLNLRNAFKTSSFLLSTLTSIDGLLKTRYPLTLSDDTLSDDTLSDANQSSFSSLSRELANQSESDVESGEDDE